MASDKEFLTALGIIIFTVFVAIAISFLNKKDDE